ncbi:hypothetical protein ymoll0001_31910 [Yersinia mollaretii ATCC 43969]|uniref:Type VI secretion system baseplate subunit TssF n=1 Tax=Yersinia mollaretii (strain ATCC 43969 / DSM 18520 / CIP 103324 / CNY 7263 / WAIP 204) TaxID=349967 RepID=A0ABP2EBN5_YERMW|nr:hypothetical protein ymoll0001_31910 [Yersinia mollaretii ATCC 43969]
MKDLTLRYYDAEMRYLRDAAKEFAQTHPDRAAMLDLDKPGTPDPYVERLFEGFAFSMGRLREKIDDDLPEFTEGLVSMLWPHYLRTIPSLSVVALTPDVPAMKMAEIVPEGMEIYSRPIGPKNTVLPVPNYPRYGTQPARRLNRGDGDRTRRPFGAAPATGMQPTSRLVAGGLTSLVFLSGGRGGGQQCVTSGPDPASGSALFASTQSG